MSLLRTLVALVLEPSILVAGLLCAALALGAQLGRSSDDWDILTHFAVVYLLGGVLVITAGLILAGELRWLLVAVGLVIVALSLWLIVPEYRRDTGPTAPSDAPRQLKLVQINVWGDENADLPGTIDWIIAQKPDVVAVEEANRRFRELMMARGGWHVACSYCDVMVFSRAAPVDIRTPQRPDNESPAPVARATFRDERGDYTVVVVHPTWPLPGSKQQYEGRILAQVLARLPQDGLILAGDFNSTPWSFTRRREDRLFGLIRRDRALASWPARLSPKRTAPFPPFLPIDHVYADDSWATVDIERGPRLGTDHYPVVITLARRAQP